MRLLPILLASLLASLAHAEIYSGRVVAIADGDTLTVLDSAMQQHKIRLGGIDAPEKRQPYGARSKQHLSDLVFGKEVEAACVKKDRYQRKVCKISENGVDANLEQIKAGLAWWYRSYTKDQSVEDQSAYAAAEREAREVRRGLWSDAGPLPPWKWRHGQRSNSRQLR